MQIIPVLDLMAGQVVRGVAGRREEYRPVHSVLSGDARPASVGRAFAELGFRTAYVADLDAIAGRAASLTIYETLMRLGLDLWVDAGLGDLAQARELATFTVDGRPLAGIIAGLESLSSPAALEPLVDLLGERLLFSLDLKAGRPLTASDAWRGLSAEQIAVLAARLGVRRLIVLDLANVGMAAGTSTIDLCRRLRCRLPAVRLVAGGGVRGLADLDVLERAGCDAALVASALHDGRLAATAALARQIRWSWPRAGERR